MSDLNGKQLRFSHVTKAEQCLVLEWLQKPHVAEWFHGDGLKNTMTGLDEFVNNKQTLGIYWIACIDNRPFSFLITSVVKEEEANQSDNYLAKWVEPGKKMITLDLFIGEEDFLGKGLSVNLIKGFIADQYKDADIIFIDPESNNKKAIHVYKKVGFKEIDTFIAPWHPVPHTLMQLKRY